MRSGRSAAGRLHISPAPGVVHSSLLSSLFSLCRLRAPHPRRRAVRERGPASCRPSLFPLPAPRFSLPRCHRPYSFLSSPCLSSRSRLPPMPSAGTPRGAPPSPHFVGRGCPCGSASPPLRVALVPHRDPLTRWQIYRPSLRPRCFLLFSVAAGGVFRNGDRRLTPTIPKLGHAWERRRLAGRAPSCPMASRLTAPSPRAHSRPSGPAYAPG